MSKQVYVKYQDLKFTPGRPSITPTQVALRLTSPAFECYTVVERGGIQAGRTILGTAALSAGATIVREDASLGKLLAKCVALGLSKEQTDQLLDAIRKDSKSSV